MAKALSADEVADEILYRAQLLGIGISPLKLQKLLYYVQGHHFATTGETLFTDTVEAWEHGPAVRGVYHRFKRFSHTLITGSFATLQLPVPARITIAAVLLLYGSKHAKALETRTHSELPWQEAFNVSKNEPIKLETMRSFFNNSENTSRFLLARTKCADASFALELDSDDWNRLNARLAENKISPALEKLMSTPSVFETGELVLS